MAQQYKTHDLPLDMICMDIDYMQGYADFTVNKERFPDLKRLADDLKAEGIRLVPIIDAGVRIDEKDETCQEGLAKGYDFDRVGGGALLAILANSTDTNIIARSSRERQLALTEELKALLAQTPYPDKDALAALDDRFIAENLSPGGSADLLALTWLLHFVTTEGNIDE